MTDEKDDDSSPDERMRRWAQQMGIQIPVDTSGERATESTWLRRLQEEHDHSKRQIDHLLRERFPLVKEIIGALDPGGANESEVHLETVRPTSAIFRIRCGGWSHWKTSSPSISKR